jgi:Spy/CpxP family protein refolding chaperone
MRRTFLLLTTALIVCVVASNCPAQGVPGAKTDNNLNQQDQVKTIFSFKDEIGITDDQEVKLKALLYDEQTFVDTNNNSLKTLGAELNDMIEKKEDMQAIKSKLEDIAKIQVEISYRNIDDSRKVEMILSPDQIAKWRDIQKKFSSQPKA